MRSYLFGRNDIGKQFRRKLKGREASVTLTVTGSSNVTHDVFLQNDIREQFRTPNAA